MLRTLPGALFVACLLTAGLEAQRGSGSSYAGGIRGSGFGVRAYAGRTGQNAFSNSPHGQNFGYHRAGAYLLPAFLPDDQSYGSPEFEPNSNESADRRVYWSEPERLPADPQMIELPHATGQISAEPPPAALFILTSGERLETRRFVLTTNDLSATVNRMERRIPISSIDLDATLAANRERGVNLQIPADRNEISLSF